jgi:hypothetical protein
MKTIWDFLQASKGLSLLLNWSRFWNHKLKSTMGGNTIYKKRTQNNYDTLLFFPSAGGCYCQNTTSKPQNWKTENWAFNCWLLIIIETTISCKNHKLKINKGNSFYLLK